MSVDKGLNLIGFEASGDLSQFRFVRVDSNGQVGHAGAGEAAHGVLQNDPGAAGQAATVATLNGGVSKVEAGGSFNAGDEVTSDGSGRAVAQTTGDAGNGIAVQGAGGSGDIVSVIIRAGETL